MRFPLLGLAIAAVIAVAGGGTVRAASDQIAIAAAPAWAHASAAVAAPADATGLVFFERQDTQVHLDADGHSHFQSTRVKLLHPQALQLGNVALTWNPSSGSATVHTIAIHRGAETINVLNKAKFEILRREDQLEQAMLTGLLTATLQVPDLRVGDVLEIAFTLRSADPTLGGMAAGLLALPETPMAGQYRLGLSWEPGQEPRTKVTADLNGITTRSADALAIAASNPAPLPAPKDAPPRFAWQRIAEYSDFSDWSAVSAKFAPLYAEAAKLPAGSPLKEEAARIKAAHSDEMERAAAALKLVQEQVRYVYVGLGAGNLSPAHADVSWQRRFADCKGKTAMLLALLAELGIRGEAVLVSNGGADDGLDARLPSPGFFDHVLVRAVVAGKPRWLDGTLPPVARPSLRPVLPYRWVLSLAGRNAKLERIDWKPFGEPQQITLYELDARKGFAVPAAITMTIISRGVQGLTEYAQLSALTADQLTNAWRANASGDFFATIESARWRYDDANDASVLTIKGTGMLDWQDEGEGGKSLTLPGGGFSPPGRRQRDASQDQTAPYANENEFVCHVTTVRLPSDTADEEWGFNTWFWNTMFGEVYYRGLHREDGTIRLVRGAVTAIDEITPEIAARDNERIAEFDNSMARIEYTPGAKHAADPADYPEIPAVWEIDWARPAAPCMPDERTVKLGNAEKI